MISDRIEIRNSGSGQDKALAEAEKAAAWCALTPKETLRARLIAEEMMSMIRSLSGEVNACFRIECEGKEMTFFLTTSILMNEATRAELINASTYRENDSAKGFLGRLRDFFERAMLSGAGSYVFAENVSEQPLPPPDTKISFDPGWDHYERSILKNAADEIRIGIRGNQVEMTVKVYFGDKA
ncbi:MAG: hypothetical protein IKI84_05865 [Clostridia bacterium]|nr:hypothetical protein [Clostridia bacterium]